ncbi:MULTISPECIES: H-NS family nucleoid-associated regulatory protein [Shewanella]|jgi:DNA-binding protein H-NS|uniref:DNA-binding protein n=3 Tax=Shewanella putrefaciens TaxID=24 RepID=E6XRF8_SHEP2|nr:MULTISPECIES: H-NS family nucleoid-associated regulatory protein [Shewanella]CAD6366051.1 DNA-binding protein H-NS [Shewanella hafniensis]ABM24334.1 histone family protein nucleoid-structuring protein H-NS [Shewanella sp. W3-18-1]AVV86067.1 histone histone family protein nucleoid-structuring protein H-NS [Shewanella putrefaciens]MCA1896445.1 H-NS histone family protein [Shewanella putrefaciens]MCK7631574.1 H-NS histone family protein [Shewanella sp. JNE9-1]
MSDFLEILTHGRRFKAAVKDLSIEELRDLASKLDKILSERESMAEEEQQMIAARNAKIEEIRQQMEAVGLSIDDLGGVAVKAPSKKRPPRPAKYQIEVDGEMIQWTGQGRMPTVFKNEVNKGRSMDDFLI